MPTPLSNKITYSFYFLLIVCLSLFLSKEAKKQRSKDEKKDPMSYVHSIKQSSNQATKQNTSAPPNFTQRAFPYTSISQKNYQHALKQAHHFHQQAQKQNTKLWQSLGPTNIGGRVTALTIPPNNPSEVYVGTASGGVFYSPNQGRNWQPIFDDQISLAIGAIATAPKTVADELPYTIYVGTGEPNAGGGSITYDGVGLLKSEDGGQNWQHMGLNYSGSIGQIAIDSQNPKRLFAAAMGSLFANNSERGLYRSKDGGENWENILYVSDSTGCADVVIHPQNPQIVYASMWERVRRWDGKQYGGKTSGLYRSKNGGDSWELLTHGLPQDTIGRIGIALSPTNPNVLYAIYAGQVGYFSGIYKTTDGGDHWKRTNDQALSKLYASYGWWFGKIIVDPMDENIVYALGLDLWHSTDGGGSWQCLASENVHVDQHALYISPNHTDELWLGNDGGVYRSKDKGQSWKYIEGLPITQFYQCAVLPDDPYLIYGSTQDNGILRNETGRAFGWQMLLDGDGLTTLIDPNNLKRLYISMQYGDFRRSNSQGWSFQPALAGIPQDDPRAWQTPILFHPKESQTLYYGTNKLYCSTNEAALWEAISPNLTIAQKFNFEKQTNQQNSVITAIAIAPSKSKVIYVGTNDGKLWLTTNNGRKWMLMNDGEQRTKDGERRTANGERRTANERRKIRKPENQEPRTKNQEPRTKNQKPKTKNLLPKRWMTSIAIHPQNHKQVYVTFSGYRMNDYAPHILESLDGGESWVDISTNLPELPINKVLISPLDDQTLWMATDAGVYIRPKSKTKWVLLGKGMPNVPVTDLVYQSGTKRLFAATYGRGIYAADIALNKQ